MAILQLEVPEHELAFLQKQLTLMGYTLIDAEPMPITSAEKLVSPAQKTMLKAFDELRAAHLSRAEYPTAHHLVEEARELRERGWGPGL